MNALIAKDKNVFSCRSGEERRCSSCDLIRMFHEIRHAHGVFKACAEHGENPSPARIVSKEHHNHDSNFTFVSAHLVGMVRR